MRGKTIQIFLTEGTPRGIKIAEITSNIEQAIFIPRNNISELQNDEVLTSGYPETIRSVEEKGKFNIHTVRASHYRGQTIPTIEFPLHLSNKKHIVIKYPKIAEDSLGKKVKLPDAPGISGGSIWAMNAKTKGIWSPENTNLYRIQIS